PKYNECLCCRNPELSVMLYGNINMLEEQDLEIWLRQTLKLPFEHIFKKKQCVGYAHIHFFKHEDTSDFFYVYKDIILGDPMGNETSE
ncbi:424_t:CDS:2, partial [Ambispora gerdemannii]